MTHGFESLKEFCLINRVIHLKPLETVCPTQDQDQYIDDCPNARKTLLKPTVSYIQFVKNTFSIFKYTEIFNTQAFITENNLI